MLQLKEKEKYTKEEMGNMIVFLCSHINEAKTLGSLKLAKKLKEELSKLGYREEVNFRICPCGTKNHTIKKRCKECGCRLK